MLAYDVPHKAPWDSRVSLYTWTKSIAAGAYLAPLLLALGRGPGRSPAGMASSMAAALASATEASRPTMAFTVALTSSSLAR